ncbi:MULTISPECIES: Cys-Gln thioester bond-forming surface protein [unclassified Nocardiopsis]|uniref:Cys-Gln thioester bond-forming surface protein n=1 Tax=unclassified Nocardiopsis TaxID=2649073 RepID=UPI00135708CB|nr:MULTISPECIES: Cys-Gln thioester bond-forming surface protein [unclassified Nocardiopsis]
MSGILRRCAALLFTTTVVGTLLGAPASHADDFSRVDRDPVPGAVLTLADGREVDTALFSLRVTGEESVRAYAAVSDEEVRPRAAYVESAWSDTPEWAETPQKTDPADQAKWIVSHSYPVVDLPGLARETGLAEVTEGQAIAGTQAALWYVLDGAEPDRGANDPVVLALYDHLVRGSAAAADNAASRSLEVVPAHVEAIAPEEPLGPLTVHSSGSGPLGVSVRGAPASWLVDADGGPVTQVHDGEQVYLSVDPSVPAGVVTLHVRGQDVPLPEGRLFTGRGGVRTRPLVTAEAGAATSSTTATFTWHPEQTADPGTGQTPESAPEEVSGEAAPSAGEAAREESAEEEVSPEAGDRIPEVDLPRTGTWLSGLLVIAGALVVSGLFILLLGRKRRG